MVDREQLALRHKAAVGIYAYLVTLPVILAAVGLWLGPSLGPKPTASPVMLALSAMFAAAPVVAVPMLRAVWRRRSYERQQDAQQLHLAVAGTLMSHMMIEMALWTAPTAFGLQAVVSGEPMLLLYSAVAVTAIGAFLNYPRWGSWEAAADEADRLALTGIAV